MKGSEIVSIVWIVFYVVFAVAAFFFANRERNKNLIEGVGAFIFSMIVVATIAGAMAPQFYSFVLGIWWYDGSNINTAATIAGIIITWTVANYAWEWLAVLASASLVLGGVSWGVTTFIS